MYFYYTQVVKQVFIYIARMHDWWFRKLRSPRWECPSFRSSSATRLLIIQNLVTFWPRSIIEFINCGWNYRVFYSKQNCGGKNKVITEFSCGTYPRRGSDGEVIKRVDMWEIFLGGFLGKFHILKGPVRDYSRVFTNKDMYVLSRTCTARDAPGRSSLGDIGSTSNNVESSEGSGAD